MKVVLISPSDNADAWEAALRPLFPALEWQVWPQVDEHVQVALVWKPPHGSLAQFPNLRLIQGLGMGVDYLFDDPQLPQVPIARLVDDHLIAQMSEYVCLEVLHQHRRAGAYQAQQAHSQWQRLDCPDTRETTVGILGMGTIGQDTAVKLHALGFQVIGWSRTKKSLSGVESFTGEAALADFLSRSQYLVCLLPLTADTRDILNQQTLSQLPQGAYLINCARGLHLVEADLLKVLESGHLAGASLDVFREEPLPMGHPFWKHPQIRVTPHVAGLTHARTAAPIIAENLHRVAAGQAPLSLVDRKMQY